MYSEARTSSDFLNKENIVLKIHTRRPEKASAPKTEYLSGYLFQ